MVELDDFRVNKEGLKKVLGELEADIMEIIWEHDFHTVRDVYEELRLKKKIAYTTVMTIMGRLADKSLLQIDKNGTAYHYFPVMTKEEFERKTVEKVIDSVLDFNNESVVNYFFEKLKNTKNKERLEKLETLVNKAKEGQ